MFLISHKKQLHWLMLLFFPQINFFIFIRIIKILMSKLRAHQMRYTDYKFRSERTLIVLFLLFAVRLDWRNWLFSIMNYTVKYRNSDRRCSLNTLEVIVILQSHILHPVFDCTAALCNSKLTEASSFIWSLFSFYNVSHPLVQISEIHPNPHPSARNSRHPLHFCHRRVGPKRIFAATHSSLLWPAVQLFSGQHKIIYYFQ